MNLIRRSPQIHFELLSSAMLRCIAYLYFGIGEASRFLALHSANLSAERLNWLAARQYYRQRVDAWRHIPEPGVSISTGLKCGSPVQVAQALAQADSAIFRTPRN